ncbi:hypothetical protein KQI63_04530 [bacterium]|nr:hypothetical protein [bacterium]
MRTYTILPAILFLALFLCTGCAGPLRTAEFRPANIEENLEEIPLEKLRVYEVRVPVLLVQQDSSEVYGYPLDVAEGEYVLLRTTWTSHVYDTIVIDWDSIDKVYRVEANYDPETIWMALMSPLLIPIGMFGTAAIVALILSL